MISAPGENIAPISGVRLISHLPAEPGFLTLRAEPQEASNRLFASNPLQSSTGLLDI